MKERIIIPVELPSYSFISYVWGNRPNRIILMVSALAMIVQFSVFKYFYPYASYIHGDSFMYIQIAYYNLDIASYMVGYGRFLRIFSVFTTSDTVLTAFQYLLIQGSALFLLFTLFYFYKPGRVVQMILLVFMVLNPLFLYMGNMVSSDGFFLALSLTWFTLLLWIIHKPNTQLIVWHTVVLFIAFTVRYNAMIFPGIATIVVLLSRLTIWKKVMAIGTGLLLCGIFVLYTGNKYKALTGKWQYSPFSGWLMANNAMYAYRYVDSAQRKPVPQQFKALDKMIRAYFDSTRDTKKFPVESMMASTVYMWSPGLPLFAYRDLQFKKDTAADEFKKWATIGPLYKAYGTYIISHYPRQYVRYFLWPNGNKYYAPPVEFLETYNSDKDSVLPIAQKWFNYKSTKVKTRTKNLKINMLNFYPIFSGINNVVMVCCLVCFAMLNGFRMKMLFRSGMLLGASIWLLNAGFTIFASSAALRFQSFPIMITTVFTALLLDWLWKMGVNEQYEQQQMKEKPVQESLSAEVAM